MKKIMLLSVALLTALILPAQGIYQFWGGTYNVGSSIFKTDAEGNNYQQVYKPQSRDGGGPAYTELIEYNNLLYGMTSDGGNGNKGVIFEFDPITNNYKTKFYFSDNSGTNPEGSLVLFRGKFYGMTLYGGSNNFYQGGVIFEWDPTSNVFTKKIDFSDSIGFQPHGDLVQFGLKLYGMTSSGGSKNSGVIFEWDPLTNIYTKKVELDSSMGDTPGGSLTLSGSKFFGATSRGGKNNVGVIFEWDPVTNDYHKMIDFDLINGGGGCHKLVKNGVKFYGVSRGGINYVGVIFEWDPEKNIYIKRIDLERVTGAFPNGNLSFSGGKFYGTTYQGGENNSGVIFEWDPASNLYVKKFDFDLYDNTKGSNPRGSLALYAGKFYGMTSKGGFGGSGVIFEWSQVNYVFIKKIDLGVREFGSVSGALTQIDDKVFGLASGGANNVGVIFEWDRSTNINTVKIDFVDSSGSMPVGSLVPLGGKFYGITNKGGKNNFGVIFEWDPRTNLYAKKYEFQGLDGKSPTASLTSHDGKLYGMISMGGNNNNGVIFEWDPSTNVYNKKIEFNGTNGSRPKGSLTMSAGKFYGMSEYGGVNNAGVIFEWDPSTNLYIKKFDDFNLTNGTNPNGNLSFYEGKFYGKTCRGSTYFRDLTYNMGCIFEWDPSSNLYTKKINFQRFPNIQGGFTTGSLTLSGAKFYGSTTELPHGSGAIFEWDPATNYYAYKTEFDLTTTGQGSNDLSLFYAAVAKGIPGSCMTYTNVSIDNSNNNQWVPIVDSEGNAMLEIKANGNNLGVVNTAIYINNSSVREDAEKRLYLDRNITVTPQVQPTSAVDVRLYIKGSEYEALKNALNSYGAPSAISSINDIGIFKNENSCLPAITTIANPIATTVEAWGADYVLTGSISSFSSFYFANKSSTALPLTLLEFDVRLQNKNALLNWKTDNEQNTAYFEIERSLDGTNYTSAGKVISANTASVHAYSFIDPNIKALSTPVIYYRLKQADINERFTYSKIISLNIINSNSVLFSPNPVTNKAKLTIIMNEPGPVNARIIDNTGRLVHQQHWNLVSGNNFIALDCSKLARGMYYLELKGASINERKQFSKQ
jgi:uncharacterized repeat protein (TIGR03803 family)